MFESLDTRKGLQWVVSFQSFKKRFIEGTANSPVYNALKRSGEDLMCKSSVMDYLVALLTNILG